MAVEDDRTVPLHLVMALFVQLTDVITGKVRPVLPLIFDIITCHWYLLCSLTSCKLFSALYVKHALCLMQWVKT